MTARPALELCGLDLPRPGQPAWAKKERDILIRDMRASLSPGELVCLVGPNGSGKSSLLSLLGGLTPIPKRRIFLGGIDLSRMDGRERARNIAYVLTETGRPEWMRAFEVVLLGRYPHTKALAYGPTERAKALAALDRLGLSQFADREYGSLSDGEAQKVQLARALCQSSSLLLLDEPTAFLDLPSRHESLRLLADSCHGDAWAAIVSIHELDLAWRYADRLWLIDQERQSLICTLPKGPELLAEMARVFGLAQELICP